MINILSKNPAFQKREIIVVVRAEDLREASVEIVAAREGWKLSFQQGPVSGFDNPENFAKLTSEDVLFAVATLLAHSVDGRSRDLMTCLEAQVIIAEERAEHLAAKQAEEVLPPLSPEELNVIKANTALARLDEVNVDGDETLSKLKDETVAALDGFREALKAPRPVPADPGEGGPAPDPNAVPAGTGPGQE